MNPEHVKVLVAKRMQEAAECLEDGKYLLSSGRGARTVVNRAYYAAFYAVLALLQTVGKTPRKHRGALTLFDTEFIRTGVLQKELSDTLHQLFDARQEDDYRRIDPVLPEEATELIADAEQFVRAIRDYLIDRDYLSEE
ncbi:MAG: HEPN domain-containing protein [Deltaproteobacteria bacterium]|nr:HEPN domain-containing protein [Deltaproteobacteria bacterium]